MPRAGGPHFNSFVARPAHPGKADPASALRLMSLR